MLPAPAACLDHLLKITLPFSSTDCPWSFSVKAICVSEVSLFKVLKLKGHACTEMLLGISKQPLLKGSGEKLRALMPFYAQLQDGREFPGAGL